MLEKFIASFCERFRQFSHYQFDEFLLLVFNRIASKSQWEKISK